MVVPSGIFIYLFTILPVSYRDHTGLHMITHTTHVLYNERQ